MRRELGEHINESVFHEIKPELQPTYVAKDLNRLPPVSFDHVDVTRLLKDILILKTELQHLRNDSISKLEMDNLKTSIVTEVCSRIGPSSDTRNVPVRSRNKVENAGTKLLNTDKTRAILTSPLPRRKRSDSLDTVVSPPSYRDIANRTSIQRINVDPMRTGCKAVNEHDDDGFTVFVNNRKKRQLRNNNRCGTATDPSKLKVAQLPEAIYLSRLETTCTVEDVKEHIESKGAQAIDVLILPQRKELDFRSFKIIVAKQNLDTFLSTEFWPADLGTFF
ncbi:unnamed protein product [Leptidea sinapis]|uniref:Uncharacterized protein n=1 Tax=Leptidea sinapis TaxID=189913 RepID=A0A5E4PPZ7_9NEOP|nr:unnamed protein product [Leptidea sinapis]